MMKSNISSPSSSSQMYQYRPDSSPASQPPPKYRTGKNSKYRRHQLFSTANIGGFKENFRRFINFEGQL